MSRFVDERVVEMSFDNKRFESNVKTSMGTINDLKNSLDFSGTANKINGELGGINVGGLSGAILSAKNSFTAFEVVAIAAIANITNRVIDLGIQMVKSLSTDQIGAGWNKFAESSISEFTLLAQGFSQESITDVLGKLAWYSDETSYSFTDMVNNMSKFTAAGKGLEESSQAMIGIANWAALAGQNSEVASRAMYQLSQAMGAGYIRLMDWKSIQNANMDTKEFRETALSTAVAMGQLTKNIDGTYTTLNGKTFSIEQFTTELDQLWFTSDVLVTTLEKYSSGADKLYDKILQDDSIDTAAQAIELYGNELNDFELKAFLAAQEARTFKDAIVAVKDAVSSGWMNIFKNIFGQVAEAKILWSDLAGELYDVFMDGMWSKINILEVWADNAGREDLFANTEENTGAFWNLFNALKAIKDLVGGAWEQVFGLSELEEYDGKINDIAMKLKGLTSALKQWTSGLFLSSEATKVVTNVFTGLFSALKIVGKTIQAVFEGFYPVFEVFKSFSVYMLGLFGGLGKEITDFSEKTDLFTSITKNLQSFFNTIISFVDSLNLVEGAIAFVDTFKKSLSSTLGETEKTISPLSVLKTIVFSLSEAFKWLGNLLNTYIVPILPKVFDNLANGLGWVIGKILLFIFNIKEFGKAISDWAKDNELIQNGLIFLSKVVAVVGGTFKKVTEYIKNFFSSFSNENTASSENYAGEVIQNLTPLQIFLKGLLNLFEGLWNVVKSMGAVVGSLFTLIGKGLTFIGDKLKELFTTEDGSLNLTRIFTTGFWALVLVGVVRFAEALRSVTQVFRDSFDSMFEWFNSKSMEQYMEVIKTMSVSILMMVGALLILGSMDEGSLKKATIALAALVGMIVTVILLMKKLVAGTTSIKGGIFSKGREITSTMANLAGLGSAFIGLGAAILLFAYSLKIIAGIDPGKIFYSLGILATMMVMLVGVMKFVGKTEKGVNKAVRSMVKIAISVALLAEPLKKIGSIDTDVGLKGLAGIALLMAIMVGFSRFSKTIEKSQKSVFGMIPIAIALTLLIVPLKTIGEMRVEDIAKGLGAIAGIFLILVGINKLLGKKLTEARVKNMTNTMWSLIPMAIGLGALGLVLYGVGKIPWEESLLGLGVISGIFLIILGFNMILGNKLTEPRVKNMTKTMWSLVPMAIGLTGFGIALYGIGSIPWQSILLGLGTIVAVFGILVGMSKLMSLVNVNIYSMLALSGSLVILSAGLLVFSLALLTLGSIPFTTVGVGLLAILGIFVILAAAGFLLQPVIPILLALSAAFSIFTLGVLMLASAFTMIAGLATVSATVFSAGLLAIAGAVVIAAPMIMKAFLTLAEGLVDIFIKLAPKLKNAFTTFVANLFDGIIELAPKLMEMLKMLLSLITGLAPEIASTVMTMIMSILDAIVTNIPEITNKLVNFFIGMIDALTLRIPEILAKLYTLMSTFINSSIEFITTMVPEMANAGFNLIIGLLDGLGTAIVERAPELYMAIQKFMANIFEAVLSFFGINSPSTKMIEVAGNLIAGLAKGLWDGFTGLISDIGKWASGIMDSIGGFFKGSFEKGKELFENLKNGAKEAWEKTNGVRSWVQSRAEDVVGLFGNKVEDIKEAGGNLMSGLKQGLETGGNNIKSTVETVAGNVVTWFKGIFGINSPSKVFADMGMYLDLGLAKGINNNTDDAYNAAEGLANETIDGFEKAGLAKVLTDLNKSLESDFDNEIVLRPVLDLSEIQNGKNRLYNMLGDVGSYNINGSNTIANRTRDEINSGQKFTKDSQAAVANEKTAPVEVMNNTFNITGPDPKAIADEISRVLQIQIDRRKAKWAT